MSKLANSVTELVGRTPIVKLNHATTENEGTVYVKLEFFNPGSSVKDRIALAMIEAQVIYALVIAMIALYANPFLG